MTFITADEIETPAGPMTRREAAAHFGINLNTLYRRLWSGWSVEEALVPPKGREPLPKARDEIEIGHALWTPAGFMTRAQATRHYDLDHYVVQWRLNRGWPLDLAIAVPLHIPRDSWSGLNAWREGIRKAKEKFYGIAI